MNQPCKCSAFALALATALPVASANGYADVAIGKPTATIIAPIKIDSVILTLSENYSVTGDLLIHIPGRAISEVDSYYLSSDSSALLAVLSDGCIRHSKSLTSCIRQRAEDGALKGDPVSSIMLNMAVGNQLDGADISITVAYN